MRSIIYNSVGLTDTAPSDLIETSLGSYQAVESDALVLPLEHAAPLEIDLNGASLPSEREDVFSCFRDNAVVT